MNEEEGLAGWEHKANEEKAKEVEEAFGTDVVVEVKEEVNKMEEKKEIKEEEKEETIEEKKDRYIDILVGIGFLKGKDKEDGKLRFYYKIDSNSAVGRTFDSRNPLGKFWCKEGENFLKDDQCKEIEIVKRFYSIREGKEEMPEKEEELEKKKEVVTPEEPKKEEAKENEIVVKVEVTDVSPKQVIQEARIKADALREVVEKLHLYQVFHGKRYLTLEAWEVLGKFCNLTANIEWVRAVELWDEHGFEARAVVTDTNGKVVSVAESMTMNGEQIWKGKPIFQLKSMSQTRSLSKAYRMCLSYIVSLAGFEATPSDEMTE